MSQDEIHNLDELLNSFLDGELDARHQTEVQRLLDHDKQIAERLQTLRNCKRLVSSLPYAEAPDGTLEKIKASLDEKKFPVSTHRQRRGARHLFIRRLVSVAAMVALVGVLGAVIYSIIAPQAITENQVAVEQPAKEVAPAKIVAPVRRSISEGGSTLPTVPFTGQLELKTSSPSEIAAFINKAIEFNIPSGERTSAVPAEPGESHVLACSRQNLKVLMDELDTVWDKINSATLLVKTEGQGQIAIDAVTPSQVVEIARQNDTQTQIKTAKFFAAMNNISESSPGKEVQVAVNNSSPRLLTIPKPVLTSNEKPVTKVAAGAEAEHKVLLTIVVTGNE
jgi:hypothetical protein